MASLETNAVGWNLRLIWSSLGDDAGRRGDADEDFDFSAIEKPYVM
jgi:hypothetical protein